MTEFLSIITDKQLKPGEKTARLSSMVLTGEITVEQLTSFASGAIDTQMATCIEALEFVSATRPELITAACFSLVTDRLTSKAPRVKWESARVIANSAKQYPGMLDRAIANLLANTEHTGTVVRWSAAQALAAILKMKTGWNNELVPAAEAIMNREEKNSIRKIYAGALKML